MAVPTGIALQLTEADNVATVFVNRETDHVDEGEVVTIKGVHGDVGEIAILQAVPYGHKIALRPLSKGEEIIKYGEVIGRATRSIRIGEHVHIHNMESCRGRGDIAAVQGRAQ